MRPRVHAEKHMVQRSPFTIALGAIDVFNVVSAVAVPTGNVQVREGAIISAIYCEMWVSSDDATVSSVVVTLEKLVGSSTNMTVGEAASLNTYDNKKNILYTFQGLTPSNATNPVPVIRQWIRIPKGKQRFSLGDRIAFNISSVLDGSTACGQFIYKEQF